MMPRTSVSPAAIRNSMTPSCSPFSPCSTRSSPLTGLCRRDASNSVPCPEPVEPSPVHPSPVQLTPDQHSQRRSPSPSPAAILWRAARLPCQTDRLPRSIIFGPLLLDGRAGRDRREEGYRHGTLLHRHRG